MAKLIDFFKSARLAEISIVSGFPIIGIFFAFKTVNELCELNVSLFVAAIFALFTAIYAFNALAGIKEDQKNGRLADLKDKKSHFIFALALSSILFLSLFFKISVALFFLSILSFILWTIYAFPLKGFKYRPILGTLIHFVGQNIHFLMAYSVISKIDLNGCAVSLYFATLFSAGHLNHELIDYEADKASNVKSGAVVFGQKKWEAASLFLFLSATLYLLIFSILSDSVLTLIPFVAAGIAHLLYKIIFYKEGASQAKFVAERRFYRSIYFLAGMIFILRKLFSLSSGALAKF